MRLLMGNCMVTYSSPPPLSLKRVSPCVRLNMVKSTPMSKRNVSESIREYDAGFITLMDRSDPSA